MTAFAHSKQLVLGCAATGAKFTPRNHRARHQPLLDAIHRGEDIPVTLPHIRAELAALYALGCRYYHFHARNSHTREQTTSNLTYQQVGILAQRQFPGLVLSFGASRNGPEVRDAISALGEWERVSQCDVPLGAGGAHFVTMQAAAELQIIIDLERQAGRSLSDGGHSSSTLRRIIPRYTPSNTTDDNLVINTYTTDEGRSYGKSSALLQFNTLARSIAARRQHGLAHEVEWVQLARSATLTRLAIERRELQLGDSRQLNIVLLFGFSPKFPFPDTYDEFRSAIELAKLLEFDLNGVRRRTVTITVGAAVLPRFARDHIRSVDVGPSRGRAMCALRRLVTYAAQPGSEVDVIRVGMEDTPYEVDSDGRIQRTTNPRLIALAREEARRNNVSLLREPKDVASRLGISRLLTKRSNLTGRSERRAA
jgi:hypothetical protein